MLTKIKTSKNGEEEDEGRGGGARKPRMAGEGLKSNSNWRLFVGLLPASHSEGGGSVLRWREEKRSCWSEENAALLLLLAGRRRRAAAGRSLVAQGRKGVAGVLVAAGLLCGKGENAGVREEGRRRERRRRRRKEVTAPS